jgi:16S rRNA (guanine1516-N2)-methyltransferase
MRDVPITSDPADDVSLRARAAKLASVLQLPAGHHGAPHAAVSAAVSLVVTRDRLELRLAGDPRGVAPQFERIDVTSGPGRSLQTPLLKAAGIRKGNPYRPRVVDATAGLGEDAWLLAAAGCEVIAIERHPAVVAVLMDAVTRAATHNAGVAARITVVHADARVALAAFARGEGPVAAWGKPDVVHLDPMFPDHAGRKTAERKPMRVLRLTAGNDDDADVLLPAALATAGRRVVVKRPAHAPPLGAAAGPACTVSYAGKAMRYDAYVV